MSTPPVVVSSEPAKELSIVASALADAEASCAVNTNPAQGIVFAPAEAIAAGKRAGNAIFDLLKVVSLLALRALIAPCEVLLRYRIGERYFNPWVTLTAMGMVAAAVSFGRSRESIAICGVFLVFLVGARIHAIVCFIRDRFGGYWHSYSEGTSWLRLPSVDRFLHRWHFTFDFSTLVLEPAFLIAAAFVVNRFYWAESLSLWIPVLGHVSAALATLSYYLLAAGIGLFVYQLYCWSERRRILLDEKDALVLMEAKQLASQPATPLGIRSYCGVAYSKQHGKENNWS